MKETLEAKRQWMDIEMVVVGAELKNSTITRQCCRTLLIPALGKQRQMDLSEFMASLIYKVKVSSRTISAVIHWNPVSRN